MISNKLDGYAADLIDGDRDPNVEWKITGKAVDDATALGRAKDIFKVKMIRQTVDSSPTTSAALAFETAKRIPIEYGKAPYAPARAAKPASSKIWQISNREFAR